MRINKVRLASTELTIEICNDTAAPLLYHTVITDSLALLAVNLDDTPSATGIHSKRQLLEFTKGLYLEYSDKDVTYPSLMADGRLFSTLPRSLSDFYPSCRAEVLDITTSAHRLAGCLPRLETISLCALLDPQREMWEFMKEIHPSEFESLITAAGEGIAQMSGVSKMRAQCQQMQAGPLVFTAIIRNDSGADVSHDAAHTTHIDIHGSNPIGLVPAVVNSPSRWIIALAGRKVSMLRFTIAKIHTGTWEEIQAEMLAEIYARARLLDSYPCDRRITFRRLEEAACMSCGHGDEDQ